MSADAIAVPITSARMREAYPAYRDSGMTWAGRIPAHWASVKLKYLVNFVGGGTPSKDNITYWMGDIPWVSPKDMKSATIEDSEDHISHAGISHSATQLIEPGAVLLVVRSGILKHSIPVAVNAKPVALNQDMKALVPKGRAVADYLAYLIRGNQEALLVEWRKVGATVESIEVDLLANTRFPVPPIPDQLAIVQFLDRETAKIDTLISKRQQLIGLLEEKRDALISHVVTKGLDTNVPMKESGVDWLGKIPAHWLTPPLYARYEVQLGKMLDSKRITGHGLAPYLRNVDVQWDHINVEDLPKMDFSESDRDRFALRQGDLLVCEGGEVGRTALWHRELEECYYQKAIHRLRPRNQGGFPRYLFYVMYVVSKLGVFQATGNPNTIDHLTAEKLRAHRLPFPPSDEQYSIVEFLDRRIGELGSLGLKCHEAIEKLCEYRTALISATVTGMIDVRGEVQ